MVLFGALALTLIVTVHEAGHFTFARLFGLRVKEFMIGLPGPSLSFKFKGTRFGVTPFLLGGYNLIAGEGGMKENSHLVSAFTYLSKYGTLTDEQARDAETVLGYDLEEALDVLDAWGTVRRVKKKGRYSYKMPQTPDAAEGQPRVVSNVEAHIEAERKLTLNAAPWYKRTIILAGGVIFNLVFAIIVFTIVLLVMGNQVATTTLDTVVDGSPAQAAGLQPGDTLVALQGQPVESWDAFTASMTAYKPGDQITISVDHNGTVSDYKITLADNEGAPMIGISPTAQRQAISFVDAFTTSVGFIGVVAQAIVKLFNPGTFNEVVSQSSSIVGISFEARDFALAGFLPFIYLVAALSVSIGLMNLLPFPPLDGGKIVFDTIERFTHRKVPASVMSGITVAVMALLVLFVIYVTNQDVHRYILGG